MQTSQLFSEITGNLGEAPPRETQFNGTFIRWGHKKRYWLIGLLFGKKLYAYYGDWKSGQSFKWAETGDVRKDNAAMEALSKKVTEEKNKKTQALKPFMVEFLKSCKMLSEPIGYMIKKEMPIHKDILDASEVYLKTPIYDHSIDTVINNTRSKLNKDTIAVIIRDIKDKFKGVQIIGPDGEKRFTQGTEKTGSFFSFGAVRTANYTFVCEGIGTAGAVYTALKDKVENIAVVAALDCGNMKHVVKEIKAIYHRSRIIIAADNDEAGINAAGLIENNNSNVIIRQPVQKGADFADIPAKERAKILIPNSSEFVEVKSLGFTDSNYYFYSTYKGGITKCSITISQPYVLDIAPSKYWRKGFLNMKGEIDYKACAEFLKQIGRDQGSFDPTKVRASGYYLSEPKTKSHKLYARSSNQSYLDQDENKVHVTGKNIYLPKEINNKGIENVKVDVKALCNNVSSFCWSNKMYGRLLVGWLLSAPFCGALPFRPHMWITGASSSGKSWVLKNVATPLLGNNACYFTGDSSEAGIRSALKYDAVPIVLDEFESEDIEAKRKRKRILELLRQTSSDSDATIVKGTADGSANVFKIVTSALLCSVRSGLDFEANRNRFIQLSFDQSKQKYQDFASIASNLDKMDLKNVRDRNIDYIFKKYEDFMTLYGKWYSTLRGRMNDHLNRCYSVVCSTLEMHDVFVDTKDIINLNKTLSEFVTTEKEQCLNHILTYELKNQGTPYGSVLENIIYLKEFTSQDRDHQLTRNVLKVHGFHYKESADEFRIFVRHPQVIKIMSTYPDSKWIHTLLSLDGASLSERRIRTEFFSGKCITITEFLERYGKR